MAEMSNLTDAASGWEGAVSGAVVLCKMKLILSDWDYIKSIFKVYFILSLSLSFSLLFFSPPLLLRIHLLYSYMKTLSPGDILFLTCFSRFYDVEQDTYFIGTIQNLLKIS